MSSSPEFYLVSFCPTLLYLILSHPSCFVFFCIVLSNSSLSASLQFNTATTETSDSNEMVNRLMTLLLNF